MMSETAVEHNMKSTRSALAQITQASIHEQLVDNVEQIEICFVQQNGLLFTGQHPLLISLPGTVLSQVEYSFDTYFSCGCMTKKLTTHFIIVARVHDSILLTIQYSSTEVPFVVVLVKFYLGIKQHTHGLSPIAQFLLQPPVAC